MFVEDVMSTTDMPDPTAPVIHATSTLREAAYAMAEHHTTSCVVVDRCDPAVVVGCVELVDLLAGRRHDLVEMSHVERVLRVPTGRRIRRRLGLTSPLRNRDRVH
jgi:CBS domain-containing protein